MSEAMVKRVDVVQLDRPFFTQEQEEMIRKSFLSGANPQEAAVLLEVAKLRRLNPITKQVHFVKRGGIWSVQVGIDGMRSIAQRSGLYGGQDEPVYEHEKDGKLRLCKVAVYRKDWERPAVGIAYFAEYAQPTDIWKRYPHAMIAKCAEALALRKAFPEDLSGIYEPSEIGDELPAQSRPSAKEAAKAKLAQLAPPKEEAQPEPEEPAHDAETGEVVEEITVPYGKEKGVPLSRASDETLAWLAKTVSANIDDPARAKWREANERLYEAVMAEIAERQAHQ